MAVTRSDVALLAGVSPAVVSYVINDGPRPVSPATREKVESAIRELGYRPNAIASALRGGATRSVGLLTPGQHNPYYAELVESVERRFTELGYLVLTASTSQNRAQEERYLHSLIDRKVDALLFSSSVTLARSWSNALAEIPVIVLDNVAEGAGLSGIGWDERADAAAAVEHLQLHGYETIACVAGPPRDPISSARLTGWRAQQEAAGLEHAGDMVAANDYSEDGGYAAAMTLFHPRVGARPRAIYVSSDVQAVGVLYACFELGLRVPEDVAVVSHDGTRAASFTTPPLTTLRQDLQYVARVAAAHAVERIETPSTPLLRLTLRGNLVIGQSCGCDLVAHSYTGHLKSHAS